MASPENKVRVFISSTFRDMHAERDHLVTVVFPELRERCERLGLEFFDVDLRWGVPEKGVDGESANSWEYCRKWINEAKPFFVCILGQRYGWEPESGAIKDDVALQAAQSNPDTQRSITDLEVHHALEHEGHSRRCFFYLRQAEAPAMAADHVDPPPLLAKLDRLKAHIRACGRPVWDYPCRWTGTGFTDMEAFGKKVLEDLWSGILRDPRYVIPEIWQQVLGADPSQDSHYTVESQPVPEDIAEKLIPLAKPPPKTPLEAEREQMQRFADSRLRWFQGRTKELDQLTAFIRDPTEDNQPRLALIAAVPGQGKSALMAKLWEELRGRALGPPSAVPNARRVEDNAPYLICHFVGATEKSSTAYHLVKRLNEELDTSGIAFPARPTPEGQPKEEPKLDFQSLCQRLYERLGDYAGEKRIVILLDALNQLDDGHDLGWLPYRLGPSVRIVVSCIEDAPTDSERPRIDGKDQEEKIHGHPESVAKTPSQKVLAALDSRYPKPKRIPLGPLTAEDIRVIVTEYLAEYCKELDAPHVDALCALPQARNPLYLLVLLAELRTLGGNDMNQHVPALIAEMGRRHPDTVSLFQWVLQRLEQAEGFGELAVRWWCLYLALGRVGMSSQELTGLLKRKLGDEAAFTAARIQRGLRRYLQLRGGTLDFFHTQCWDAVIRRSRFNECGQASRDIAAYFLEIFHRDRRQTSEVSLRRALSELPHHQIQGQAWHDLANTLEDLCFLEAKCAEGLIYGLVEDFMAAGAAMPITFPVRQRLRLLGESLRRDVHFIDRNFGQYPQALFQSLWNSAWWYDCKEYLKHYESAPLTAYEGGPSVSDLLQRWRSERQKKCPGFIWLRALRPPAVRIGSGQTAILRGHKGGITSVAISPDGCRIASASHDCSIRIWDAKSGICVNELRGHEEAVWAVAFSLDGGLLVSGSMDATMRLWDARSGECLSRMHSIQVLVSSVAFSPAGNNILAGAVLDHVGLWDAETGIRFSDPCEHEDRINCVAFSPDGRQILSGSR